MRNILKGMQGYLIFLFFEAIIQQSLLSQEFYWSGDAIPVLDERLKEGIEIDIPKIAREKMLPVIRKYMKAIINRDMDTILKMHSIKYIRWQKNSMVVYKNIPIEKMNIREFIEFCKEGAFISKEEDPNREKDCFGFREAMLEADNIRKGDYFFLIQILYHKNPTVFKIEGYWEKIKGIEHLVGFEIAIVHKQTLKMIGCDTFPPDRDFKYEIREHPDEDFRDEYASCFDTGHPIDPRQKEWRKDGYYLLKEYVPKKIRNGK